MVKVINEQASTTGSKMLLVRLGVEGVDVVVPCIRINRLAATPMVCNHILQNKTKIKKK